MLQAHIRASKGKRHKKEIILFEMDLETNLIRIIDDIKNGTYKFGAYREFIVYEPKERIIKSLPYRDRVVHQWYIEEFIKPFFYPRFIKDTYACLDERGTHKCVSVTQKYMRRIGKKHHEYYVLKCDVKKYFYNIDKNILIDILKRNIKDDKLIEFSKVILDDGETIGIPIGNYTSQYYANIYLNELDHFVKEKLRVKYYIRYMDDFILLLDSREEAKRYYDEIAIFLKEKLHLDLNSKSKYFPSKYGIDFCGYRIFETHIILRKRFKKKLKKNIYLWKYLKDKNILDRKKMELSWNSYLGHASHANAHNFINKEMHLLDELNLDEK